MESKEDEGDNEKNMGNANRKKRLAVKAEVSVKVGHTSLKRGKLAANWSFFLQQQGSDSAAEKSKVFSKKIVVAVPKRASMASTTSTTTTSQVNTSKVLKETTSQGDAGKRVGMNTASKVDILKCPGKIGGKPSTGRCIAIDCEMVGVNDGKENMLARVSLVDENGTVVYDTFVKPQQRVTDYRTAVSGVRPIDMVNGKDFTTVQSEVSNIIHGKLLVGHAVRNDLKVLYLSHPKHLVRDTSKFQWFRHVVGGHTPSLRLLASKFLDMDIQQGEHNSVEDARAAMALYMKYRDSWESELRSTWNKDLFTKQ